MLSRRDGRWRWCGGRERRRGWEIEPCPWVLLLLLRLALSAPAMRMPAGIPATSMQHPCNIHATFMQHPCSIHATSMQHPCNGACGHTRYTGVSSPAPGALFTAQRCWSGCEACGGHVARRRGQHGMTCGQRGAREPRRRLNRQHARARGSFFSCEHREEQVIYTTVLPALQSCRAVFRGVCALRDF